MRLLLAVLPLCLVAAERLDNLRALPAMALHGETHHVQGIDVNGTTVWVSSVDARNKRGLLFVFDGTTGHMRQSVEVQSGERFHPGGISLAGGSVWVPVAEYRRAGTTSIQKRNRRTLALEAEFAVEDHIGAVAVVPQGLASVNWGAHDFYIWNTDGKLQRKMPNPTGVAFQDMKYVEGALIAGGLERDGTGAVVWLEWPTLKELRRMRVGRTDRGVVYTREGLAISGRTLYLLPEDAPSRLFAFELP